MIHKRICRKCKRAIDSGPKCPYCVKERIDERKNKTLIAYRVLYGSSKTSKKDREYRLHAHGPVGTKSEWRKYAKTNKRKIVFREQYK
jgi:hypothetical protein